jgi:Holliday junction resolvasome RuvABC DNA-binding subunit
VAAISHEDLEQIDAVPRVGAKVAERIARELRDKDLNLVAPVSIDADASSNGHADAGSLIDDAVSALINLGYYDGKS